MTLNRVTISDRQRLVDALDLPVVELEEYSALYFLLVELESREDRLGVDLLTKLRNQLTEIESIEAQITTLKIEGGGQGAVGTYSQTVVGEYSYSQSSTGTVTVAGEEVGLGSPLAGLLSQKGEIIKDIHRQLNAFKRQDYYPTNYQQMPFQSINLG